MGGDVRDPNLEPAPLPSNHVQPAAHRACTPQDSCEGGPTENHKFTEDIMRLFSVCAVL